MLTSLAVLLVKVLTLWGGLVWALGACAIIVQT